MGGGDLNTKKSWHPNTIKNQEKVWKAEQQEAAEKRKLADLQREITDERNREDLKNLAMKSGYINNDEDKKLEWMYKGPQQLLNREEYLLGRQIDKNFEQLDELEKEQQRTGITVPKNHVEHECVPFSIRQYKNMQTTEQVDMARKLVEDPLMAIKQREIETRQKILENPVKLKELHRLLKSEKELKLKKSKKKDKKHKKSKKKSKDYESDDEKNLDQILAKKYKKLQGTIKEDDDSQDMSLDKLLSKKYNMLSKELGKMAKKQKSKSSKSESGSESDKKTQRNSRARSSSEDSNRDSRQNSRPHNEDRKRGNYGNNSRRSAERHNNRDFRASRDNRDNNRDRYNNPRHDRNNDDRNYSNNFRSRDNRSPPRNRNRSRSTDRQRNDGRPDRRHRSRDRNSRERRRGNDSVSKHESSGNRKSSSSSSSGSESPPPRKQKQYDSDDDSKPRPIKKSFGLVTASGKQLSLSSKETPKFYTKDELRNIAAAQKPSWTKPEKKKLTEEEMEQKRLEMLKNAEWRDEDRERKIKRYNQEDERESEKHQSKEFDHDFINKQLRRAANNETVESRIKSNRNNIQRSAHAMDSNFARR